MPTSSQIIHEQHRLQQVRQANFDRRMTAMIRESQPAPAPAPAPQKASPMATNRLIDIKGLNTKAIADVGAKMAGIRDLVAKVQDSGNRLQAELTDVHEQIEQARQDLRFHAESMGNSGSTGQLTDEEKEREDAAEEPSKLNAPPDDEHHTQLPVVSIDEALK